MSDSLQDRMIPYTSEARIKANGQNAKKSTGPKTTLGKRNSSRNAIKHGIFSSVVIADSEDQKLYDDLVTELCNESAPVGKREQMALEKAVVYLWRERRALNYETRQCDSREQAGLRQQLGNTIQYEAHLRKGYKEAIQELEKLQAERKGKQEQNSEIPAESVSRTTQSR